MPLFQKPHKSAILFTKFDENGKEFYTYLPSRRKKNG